MGDPQGEVNGARAEGTREKCPDCRYCQLCSRSRCRRCRSRGAETSSCSLKAGFTYGEYLSWKEERPE